MAVLNYQITSQQVEKKETQPNMPIQPNIFRFIIRCKKGDYARSQLPEEDWLKRWGALPRGGNAKTIQGHSIHRASLNVPFM